MQLMKLPKGAVIHFHGMPFELPAETDVLGVAANLAQALKALESQAGHADQQAAIAGLTDAD